MSWFHLYFNDMVITFLTMYNINQLFHKAHENYKSINLNISTGIKYIQETLLTCNKSEQKIMMNL